MIRKTATPSEASSSEKGGSTSRVAYLSSQYLMNSSLSQDVNQFDFNVPASAYNVPNPLTEGNNDNKDARDATMIEMDDLNNHPCMITFLNLIRHMRDNKVYSVPTSGDVVEQPSWMACLHKKLTDATSHINAKLFIAKMVVNEAKIFEPFAQIRLLASIRYEHTDQSGNKTGIFTSVILPDCDLFFYQVKEFC